VRILTYHRVIDPNHPTVGYPALVSATPAAFDRQMQYLARHYNVVSATRVLDALHGGPHLPPRSVLITFDDAYADFAEVAWPILRRYGLPATLFVPTAYPDDPGREFWWDRLHRVISSTRREELVGTPLGRLDLQPARRPGSMRVLQRWLQSLPHTDTLHWVDMVCRELGMTEIRPAPVLKWDELRRLAADGVALAPHTRTHARLDRMSLDAAAAEIRGSRDDLEREVGTSAPMFAYPFGARDERVTELLKQEGWLAAMTQRHGHNTLSTVDPFSLRRTNISRRTSPVALALRLTSTGARLDGWRHAYRRIRRSWRGAARRVGGGAPLCA
jgi:peptidoglycan/xylan/chitin deacetylase (PgdA/CDA1 family)